MNLTISSQTINQYNGLFSLNDLHKVSGNEKRHEPNRFLRNQQTKDLIAEIESENQIAYHTVQGGNVKTVKQGTYVCRELVYAYAMWISAKFSLMVIRAFHAMNTGAIPCVTPKTTTDDRTPLRQAVINNEHNAFWRKVGLLEYDRLDKEIRQLQNNIANAQRIIDQANTQLDRIAKTKGLLYDALDQQQIPKVQNHNETRTQAIAFINRQMTIKINMGLIT